MRRTMVAVAGMAMLAACSGGTPEVGGNNASDGVLRNLALTNEAAPAHEGYRVQGTLIPTPSDPRSRYYLLRERKGLTGTITAIVRQELDGRIAYARTEVDCSNRLFHILSVGPTREAAELRQTYTGPLRPITGLPLRQDLARFVCERSGTPLAGA